MTAEFEVVDAENTETSPMEDHRQLPWRTFGLGWLAAATLTLSLAALVGKATGLLGTSYDGEWSVIGGGVFGAWLGTMVGLGLAWTLARRADRDRATPWRLAASLVAGQAVTWGSVSVILVAPVEFVANAAWSGGHAAVLTALGLATVGILLGSRLLGPTIATRRLIVPATGFAIVALAMIPFADPSDLTDLTFGVSIWCLGPVWFGLAAPRWFGNHHPTRESWPARLRAYAGITMLTLGTAYLAMVPRVIVGSAVL